MWQSGGNRVFQPEKYIDNQINKIDSAYAKTINPANHEVHLVWRGVAGIEM